MYSINLDEYRGISPENENSYRYFMNSHLFDAINIDKKNTFVPDGMEQDTVRGNRAVLKDGTIAGSATNLYDCMRTAIRMGVPKEEAVRAATVNPARAVGLEAECGVLLPGRKADILVADREFALLTVLKSGHEVQVGA